MATKSGGIGCLSLIVAAAVLLTSCGSDSDTYETGRDLADAVGCNGYIDDSEELFVLEGGGCELDDGTDVAVYTFSDSDARDAWLDVAQDFGGVYLVGDAWVVDADWATLDDLQPELGGDIT